MDLCRFLFRNIKGILILVLFSIVQTLLACTSCRSFGSTFWIVISFTFSIWFLLTLGNGYLGKRLSEWISWVEFPVKRLVIGLLVSLVYTSLITYGLLIFYEYFLHVRFYERLDTMIYISWAITLAISLVLYSRDFLLAWKEANVRAERFKHESIAAKFESLRNQVDPHFLFNSLNVVSHLVYEDPDKAVKFIKQLSNVYRYVLDTQRRELVPLDEELEFIEAYSYLQQIRFEQKLRINVDIQDHNASIIPLSLQMLVENAIKHNEVSSDRPLTIQLYQEADYLVVRNNLQPKMDVQGTGLGLENIRNRYAFVTNREVTVASDIDSFTVKIPLIKNE